MNKPWFTLDPNNLRDRWWLYTSITDTKKAFVNKNDMNVECYFIIQDHNMGGVFYRVSVWFKDDPNRYIYTKYESDWIFDKNLNKMNEGDIVKNKYNCKFKVYDCSFVSSYQKDMCKILERVEE